MYLVPTILGYLLVGVMLHQLMVWSWKKNGGEPEDTPLPAIYWMILWLPIMIMFGLYMLKEKK